MSDFYKDLLQSLYEGVYFVDLGRSVTFWNAGAERLTGFSSGEVVGRCCRDNILMHLDKWGHSLCAPQNCPAQLAMEDGREREVEVCYHHKQGHLVPAMAKFIPYCNERGQIIGAIEVFQDTTPVVEEREKVRELEKLALLDPLTEVANRRLAEIRIQAKLNELRRHGWPFGVLFCDINDFKRINDEHGHACGDKVLRTVAKTLFANLRSSDLVCRWGGDEFLVVLTNVRDHSLGRVAEKIRRMVEQCSIPMDGQSLRVSLSMGVTSAGVSDSLESLVRRADRLMYQCKRRKDGPGNSSASH